jgi:hypothetical protein
MVVRDAGRIFLAGAPSFNGRTSDSDSLDRGSNPWGATNSTSLNESPDNKVKIECVRGVPKPVLSQTSLVGSVIEVAVMVTVLPGGTAGGAAELICIATGGGAKYETVIGCAASSPCHSNAEVVLHPVAGVQRLQSSTANEG